MKNLTGEFVYMCDEIMCPVCGSEDIDDGDDFSCRGWFYLAKVCHACGSKFSFAYKLDHAYVDEDNRKDG